MKGGEGGEGGEGGKGIDSPSTCFAGRPGPGGGVVKPGVEGSAAAKLGIAPPPHPAPMGRDPPTTMAPQEGREGSLPSLRAASFAAHSSASMSSGIPVEEAREEIEDGGGRERLKRRRCVHGSGWGRRRGVFDMEGGRGGCAREWEKESRRRRWKGGGVRHREG